MASLQARRVGSKAELLVESLQAEDVVDEERDVDALDAAQQAQLRNQLHTLRDEEARLSSQIDELYDGVFRGLEVSAPAAAAAAEAAESESEAEAEAAELEVLRFDSMTEGRFAELGRQRPPAAAALMAAAEVAAGPERWRSFQSQFTPLTSQATN
ncbi:hypothetical protein GPECTOR_29g60 [Gonium pectorale]|uniref:Uncharacterized protein n=1 Tax=Gonium pectorale TaxID=33097 RepID=A0A150GEN2_GONPE|nr:hypothetical protein GPECTOR_29g60 [Gonium pectorale]|eukprot:KXZ48284.1 hypothetical protein GPECTOR_29g60 [Gonium pectorale]